MTDLLKTAGKLATMEEVSAVNIGIKGLGNDLKDINKKLNELEPHSRVLRKDSTSLKRKSIK